MFGNLFRRVFERKRRRSNKAVHRPFTLSLETLEDRLVPAVVGTLSQSGEYLIYTASGPTHNIVISGTDAAFTIQDTAAPGGSTLTSTVTGFPRTAPAATGLTGSIPASVTTVLINAGQGVDIVTVPAGGLNTFRSIEATSNIFAIDGNLTTGGIDFTTRTGGAIELNGATTSLASNKNPVGGAIDLNGNVTLSVGAHNLTTDSVVDGNILVTGSITGAGAANLAINSPNLTGPLNSGGNLTVLGSVLLGGSLTVGSVTGPGANNISFAKSITVTGAVTLGSEAAMTLPSLATSGAVTLTAGGAINLLGGISQTGAPNSISIEANSLNTGTAGFSETAGTLVSAGAGSSVTVDVGGTGNLNITGVTTGAGGSVGLFAGGSINITGVITAPGGGSVTLIAGAGIPDLNGSAVNVSASAGGFLFVLAGTGGVNLDTQVGSVYVTASTTGNGFAPISLRNSGQPLTIDNATTTNGAVTISNNDEVTVAGLISAAGTQENTTLTTTVGTGAGDVTIEDGATVAAGTLATVTILTPGFIQSLGGSSAAVSAGTVVLQAGTGISGTVGPLGTSLPVDADNVSAVTISGGIALAGITSARPLTVSMAIATSGAITLSTPSAATPNTNDLNITGEVTTSGSNILIEAGEDLTLNLNARVIVAGTPPAGTNITLDAEQDLFIAQGSQVTAVNNIVINDGLGTYPLGTFPTTVYVMGAITAGGPVTLNGSINNDLIVVGGPVSAPGGLDIIPGLGADELILTPSATTAFTIDLRAPGFPTPDNAADTIIINAPVSTVVSESGTGVTFTVYQPWTILGFNAAEGDTILTYG